jgi:hypothetical protein
MRMIFKVTLIILLLPIVGLVSLYLTGVGMSWYLEHQQASVRATQDEISTSGNGFGGEAGMVVVDSGFVSKRFSWLDNDHLVINTEWIGKSDKNEDRLYVWNVASNQIKPVDIYGRLFCARGKDVYFIDGNRKPDATESSGGFSNKMRGDLVEVGSVWKFTDVEQLAEIWSSPDERYEFAWTVLCTPWFRVKPELRSESDLKRYNFKSLPEWGWVMRYPAPDLRNYDLTSPEMGFFGIGAEPYFEQPGQKISELADWSIIELGSSELRYVDFLDRYWMAVLSSDIDQSKMMGFFSRDGRFQKWEWSEQWPQYVGMPLPTRKGMFWSGDNFRLAAPGRYDTGSFLEDSAGNIHQVTLEYGFKHRLSPDGCRVAFYGAPKHKPAAITLKYFDACRSTLNEKEFEDVEY